MLLSMILDKYFLCDGKEMYYIQKQKGFLSEI